MDIRVYDKNLVALGVVDEMASLIWSIKYFSVGEAKILAPMTENNRNLLLKGHVIIKHDEYIDYVDSNEQAWRRAAEITYVRYAKDVTGHEQIEVNAQMISCWFNQRVINPQIQMTGTCQQVVNKLIDKNVGSGAAASRRFNMVMLSQGDLGGTSFEYSNEALKALGDEIRDVCQQGKIGYDILINEKTKEYGFYLYDGRNLTSGNTAGNPPCVFSRDFDNVNEQEYEDDSSNIKNYAFVRGAADSNNNQEVVTVDAEGATGFNLKEVLIDASDIQRTAEDSSGEQQEIPIATYRKMLQNRGTTELAQLIENYTFNSSINVMSNLRYKEDFDLGDRVTCVEKKWGITINSRITELTQTFEAGRTEIVAVFGESAPTLLDKIKKAR